MEPQTTIFLGPQGSGKGTQVGLFKKFLQDRDSTRRIVHMEMGAALRAFAAGAGGGYTQDLVRTSLARGEFQPAFISSYLMAKIFIDEMRGDEHFIVDGFPREPKQAAVFDTAMDFYKRDPRVILNITVPEEESVTRLLARGRNDDTEAGIRERLRWNREQVDPMIDAYRSHPAYMVADIDGMGSVDEVHRRILTALKFN
ncbi:MAG: adenylate kinase family protein [Minisyncoccia bacterium]